MASVPHWFEGPMTILLCDSEILVKDMMNSGCLEKNRAIFSALQTLCSFFCNIWDA